METIVMIMIAASLIYLFEYRTTSKPIKLEVKHENERLPHEIFPQLLYWKAGDVIVRKQLFSEHEFLGVLEGKIVLKSSSQCTLLQISPEEASKSCYNRRAMAEMIQDKELAIKKEISNNPYN
jgi:hypothetical protein